MSETVSSGNSPYNVMSAQTDTGDLVVNGGSMLILSGGVADTTTVDTGGILTIASGGIDNSTILSDGIAIVSFGGTDLSTQISGGEQNVYGTAGYATVFGGGIQTVEGGGIASGTTLDGGTEIVASGGAVGGTTTFVGSGELILDQSSTFGGTISGLSNIYEKLDLADISFGSTTSMTYSGNTLSGTLTVTDGTNIANLQLIGDYTISSFTSASDGNGGTVIVDPTLQFVSMPGSNIDFSNAYDFNTTTTFGQEYVNCILAAEETLGSLWTNPVFLNLTFTEADISPQFLAQNLPSTTVEVSYQTLTSALKAFDDVEDDPYGPAAAASLPASNPAPGDPWTLSEAYARMLGLSTATYATDDTVTIGTGVTWGDSQAITDALIHEISEGGMGRIGGLGDAGEAYANNIWGPPDLFRYSAAGTPDYSDGKDGEPPYPYFSYNGGQTLSDLVFNDRYGPASLGNVSNGDTADFNDLDVFGYGDGYASYTLSQTDVEFMDVLGWDPSSNFLWQATGDGDGSGDFTNSSYWLEAGAPSVPGPTDTVIIDPAILGNFSTSPFEVYSSENDTINALITAPSATLAIAGGIFSITSGTGSGTFGISAPVNAGAVVVSAGASLLLGGIFDDTGEVEALGGTIDLSGELYVGSGGTSIATSVLSGAIQYVQSGGYANGTTVDGIEEVFAGGTASATIVSSGGTDIDDDGIVIGATVDNGGVEQINFGSAVETIVNSGGSEVIGDGDEGVGTTIVDITINSGGSAILYQSATLSGSIVDNGAITIAGGTLSGTITGTGSLIVEDTPLLLGGGNGFGGSINVSTTTLELSSAGAAGSAGINFAGPDSLLQISGTAMPTNTISGFITGDAIDLAQIAFSSSGTVQLEAGNVLQVVENGVTYKLHLNPSANYTSASFTLSQDDSDGTFIALGQSVVASSLIVSAGQIASNLLLLAEASLTVLSGGTADLINVGVGSEYLSAGGVASNTNVNGGTQTDSGTASATTVVSGGHQYVAGVANGTMVLNGGRQFDEPGAAVSGTVVSGGSAGSGGLGGPNGSWQVVEFRRQLRQCHDNWRQRRTKCSRYSYRNGSQQRWY